MGRVLWVFVILTTAGLVSVACQDLSPTPTQETAPPAEEEAAAATEGEPVEQVAVLLPASQTDQGWNQQAADSMAAVQAEYGDFTLEIAENLGYGDITPVLRDLAQREFDLIICHASGYQTICPEFAQETGVRVAVVENPNAVSERVADIETEAQEVAYLAGVLAAQVTETGVVGVVVSGEPPTWNFMTVGFVEGVKATDPAVEVLYGVIGEAAYEDAAGAKRTTETQLAADADVIFGMGDGATFGMLQAIEEHNATGETRAWFIDVIGDKREAFGESLLSSILFDYRGVYRQMIEAIETGGQFGRVYTMDIASGAVRLLEPPPDIPAEALEAVEAAREAILAGETTVSAIGDAKAMRARLEELRKN